MNKGHLSGYFTTAVSKKLSAVEVNPQRSNQHEFNGSKELKKVFTDQSRMTYSAKFIWIQEENAALAEEGFVTWYDSRENHPFRTEFRLYFSGNPVMSLASEGDTLFIARRTDDTILLIVAASKSTIESQLFWLFGLSAYSGTEYQFSDIEASQDRELDYASRFILEELGIEVEEPENDRLDYLLRDFGLKFPTTQDFTALARRTIPVQPDSIESPDDALIAYMEWEEKLFRRMERRIVAARMSDGFIHEGEQDVDGFLAFSLGVQNRRKSRAGYAFESHITYIFNTNKLVFTGTAKTENKARPDFLFPSEEAYHNPDFPVDRLIMMGAKTTCKDRWRQILSEAAKIKYKHLLTLEPGISENQTQEMKSHNLQLILPKSLHRTYQPSQRSQLMTLRDFIGYVKERQ